MPPIYLDFELEMEETKTPREIALDNTLQVANFASSGTTAEMS